MNSIITSQLYFFFLTLGVYALFGFIAKKFKSPLLNPLLWTSLFIIGYLLLENFIMKGNINETVTDYSNKMSIVNAMLSPLTVCLALPVYTRRHIIKQYWLPILIGTVVGTAVSMGSVYILGKIFGLDKEMIASLLPKSVTTAIAIEVSTKLGGIRAITISVVIITGIFGALFGPILCKIFKIDNAAAIGMSFGGSSHAVGTSKAVEISTRAGAISSVAIVTSGLLTVLIALFL